MQFSINRDIFTEALSKVQGIVDKRGSLICSNVLMEAVAPDTLRLTATDLEVSLQGSYKCSVEETGALAVGARSLYDMVKVLPAGMVSLTAEENSWLRIANGKVDFRLVGMSGSEFPRMVELDDVEGFTMPVGQLSRMVDRVKFTVSNDDSRPTLNGLFVKPEQGEDEKLNRLMMVSTDGHRLSKVVEEVENDILFGRPDGVIVPKKGLLEFNKIFGSSKDDVFFGMTGNHAVFRTQHEVLIVRLIEGVFPDFTAVIPRQSRNVIVADKDALIDALRRAAVVADPKHTLCSLKVESRQAFIGVDNPDIGRIREEVAVEYEGEDVEIGYNVYYLLECVGAILNKSITFEMNDSISPGILRATPGDESFYVVMPMRI